MPLALELEHGAATELGGRDVNADHFIADGKKRLFAVADGVGDRVGKIASRHVCLVIRNKFRSANPQTLLSAALKAHEKLRAGKLIRDSDGSVGKPCTTLSALHLGEDNVARIVHAGDSSVYRLRKGELKQLTVPLHPGIQGIGGREPKVVPTVKFTDAKGGDVFLLCTDGVTGNEPGSAPKAMQVLTDKQIHNALGKTASGQLTPQQTAQHLTQLYLQAFSDSRTAIVVKVKVRK